MRHVFTRPWAIFCLLLLTATARAQGSEIMLSIAGHKLRAEVAATHDARAQGLMFRDHMAENRGMLFCYPEPGTHSMWMMNTKIPLSVAFVGRDGRILNIEDMEPQTVDIHSPVGAAAYALEMNRGWFAQHGIGRGARVEGLNAAPKPE